MSRIAIHKFGIYPDAPLIIFTKTAGDVKRFAKAAFAGENLPVSGDRNIGRFGSRHIDNGCDACAFAGRERT